MENKIKRQLGDKLRKLRMENNYTQEYLAEVLGVSQKTYSNMENNKKAICIDDLHKLAEEYGIEESELLKDTKIIVQNNSLHDTSTINGVFNHQNDKIIEVYTERIAELKTSNIEKDKKSKIWKKE